MAKDNAGVYCLINKNNGKKYVGSSKHIKERLSTHLMQLENHIHSNKALQEAFDKDGLNFVILENIANSEDKDSILRCEQYWIDYYKTTNPKYGYNKVNSKVSAMPFKRKNVKNLTRPSIWYIIIDEIAKHNKYMRILWQIIKRSVM